MVMLRRSILIHFCYTNTFSSAIMFISHRVMDGYNDDKETVDR